MSAVGPELPPHLIVKRKRQQEEQIDEPVSARSRSASSSIDTGEKRRRILGPSLPPAALSERPSKGPELDAGGDSDSDSNLGPAPPPAVDHLDQRAGLQHDNSDMDDILAKDTVKKPQREEWMLVPPKQDDWTSRVDPTKLRNRKFNTGKGAKAPSQKGSADNALWTETVEQKRQRLEDEVMGVKKPAQLDQDSNKSSRSEAEARETERRILEYNQKNRNSSLYNEHKKATPKEKEDDPSKRAFDKEKDIGGGMKIGHAKKKELLNKAADFGSRFAGGNYL